MPKTKPKTKISAAQLLEELQELQGEINEAQDFIDENRARRDKLIRVLVNRGSGVRELATQIDTYPSTITRVCQRHPAVTPFRKGFAGGRGHSFSSSSSS